jgi:hypothetical protein
LPPGADTFYIHDVAVAGGAAGTGSPGGSSRISDVAREHGFRACELVSVQGRRFLRFGAVPGTMRQACRPQMRAVLRVEFRRVCGSAAAGKV